MVGTKEHYELLENFEKHNSHMRLDRENKELWYKGQVYQDGDVNRLYNAFILGYSFGRASYLNG